jgi:hypothetical protein
MITVEQTVRTINVTVEDYGHTYEVQTVIFEAASEKPQRPVVSVFGREFFLVKHPNNNVLLTTIQNNDMIVDGWRNNTTYWNKAICINENSINNDASWNVIDLIEDITLV